MSEMDHLVLFCAANVEGEEREGVETVELGVVDLDMLKFDDVVAREEDDVTRDEVVGFDEVDDLDELDVRAELVDFDGVVT